MAGSVVVGVDGSKDSGKALTWAAAEAQARGSSLLIIFGLHMPVVSVPFGGAMTVPPVPELETRVEGLLEAAVEVARTEAPTIEIATEIAHRPPADVLIDASSDASLVVVGTRGLSGLGAAFLGSVSARVAAHSFCPTVVVPPDAPASSTGPVVVGVDGSAHSDAAVRFALDEAARRGAVLVAVHAYRWPVLALPVEDPQLLERLGAEEHQRAEQLVLDALERTRNDSHAGVDVTTRVVAANPGDAVTEAAKDAGAALTVVGSRGRGGVAGLLLGSVSQSVLHQAAGPVAVVHVAEG